MASRRRFLPIGSMTEMTRHWRKTAYLWSLDGTCSLCEHASPLSTGSSCTPPSHVSLPSPIDPLACTSKQSLHWASLHCAPTHRHSRFSRYLRNAFTTSNFPSQSMSGPLNPCDVIALTIIINWFMPCMPNTAFPAPDQRWRPAVCYASLLPIRSPMSMRNGTWCRGQLGKVTARHSCSCSLQ